MKKSLKRVFTQKGVFDAAPSFDADFIYYDDRDMWKEINCVGYALGYRALGLFSLLSVIQNDISKHVLKGIPNIIAHTNIVPIENNKLKNIPEGHYPVALFFCPSEENKSIVRDIHVFRMDRDGSWSHKQGWEDIEATKFDSRNQPIKDPLSAKRLSFSESYDYSRFLGFFAVPKGGAKFFFERQNSYADIYEHIRMTLKQRHESSKQKQEEPKKKSAPKRKERKSNKGISLSYEF